VLAPCVKLGYSCLQNEKAVYTVTRAEGDARRNAVAHTCEEFKKKTGKRGRKSDALVHSRIQGGPTGVYRCLTGRDNVGLCSRAESNPKGKRIANLHGSFLEEGGGGEGRVSEHDNTADDEGKGAFGGK